MVVNYNEAAIDEDSSVNLTIHSIGDTKSIYSERENEVEKSVTDLLERHKSLTAKANNIFENNTINYDSVLSVESIIPGLLTRNMPPGGFTYEPSKTNLSVSMEAISVGKVTLLGGAIALICGIIYKLVKKIIDFINGNSKNIESTVDNIDTLAKSMKNVEQKAKSKEAKLKNAINNSSERVEISTWVNDNKDVKDLLFRLCRLYKLSSGIDVDPTKPVEAIKAFTDNRTSHKENAQGNLLANKLPAIMFSDDLAGDFKRYFEYYNYLKLNIRKINTQMQALRSNMIRALSGTMTPLKTYDYGDYLTPISALLQMRHSDPVKATAALKQQVTSDWLGKYQGPVRMDHVGAIINLINETSLLKQLVTVSNDKILETEIAALMHSTNNDLQNSDSPHQKAIQDLRNSEYCTPQDKVKRIQLSEAYMGIIKENLNIIKTIADTNTIFYGKFIEALRNIEAMVKTYNAYYMHYNMFLDKYDAKFN